MNSQEVQDRLMKDSFDALIINGKMPGGWGAIDVYRWIEENRPAMQRHLLFTFSSVAEPELRAFLQERNIPYLAKPFEVADLILQARRLLVKAQVATV